jgi:TonB family protein
MIDTSLRNLGVYVLQILLLVSAASLAASLLHLAMPRARLIYWRIVVFACLMLPLVPVRHIDLVAPTEPTVTSSAATATAIAAPIARPAQRTRAAHLLIGLLPWTLIVGVAGRTIWLGVGFVRLRRLRRRGTPALLDEDVLVLQRALAPHAELRWHERLAQPVTFGLRRPVVLLPSRLGTLPLDIQRAVVCHELLHVGRRDWLWTLGEESVRTLFWFHPAMRWALAQVQLSREETVDRLAVALTGARRSYMNALMLFAPVSNDPTLAPAILFVRRRHLVLRMTAISQEVRMSPLRLAITGIALVGALIGTSWGVVSALPLHASAPGLTTASADVQLPGRASAPVATTEPAPQATTTQVRVVDEANTRKAQSLIELRSRLDEIRAATASLRQAIAPAGAVVIKEVKPQYPPDLMRLGLSADVTLSVTITAAGDVREAEAVSWGMKTTKNDTAKTTEAATTAAAQPFVDAAKAAARQWKFKPADAESTVEILFTFATRSNAEIPGGVSYGVVGGVPGGVGGGVPGGVGGGVPGGVGGGVGGGIGSGVAGGVPGGLGSGVGTTAPGVGATVTGPALRVTSGRAPLRVGGNVRAPAKIVDVKPVYPEEARSAGVQGVVILEVHLAADGSVADARILRSIPLLDQAALDAVRHWRFAPTLLNGEPIDVLMTVTLNFVAQ